MRRIPLSLAHSQRFPMEARCLAGRNPGLFAGHAAALWAMIVTMLILTSGCGRVESRSRITLWHQMMVTERGVLQQQIDAYQAEHPNVEIRAVYKETEELRSSFQAAVLAGTGPDLIFGPSDSMGAFVEMGIVQDLSPYFPPAELSDFIDQALIRIAVPDVPTAPGQASPDSAGESPQALVMIGDRVGNHLALVYNRQFFDQAPIDSEDLIRQAVAQTRDLDGDGRIDQYGLVFNFTEPFFLIPFLSGYGGWVFEATNDRQPALNSEAVVKALEFVADLQRRHQVLPANCDYETADALFKSGKAAMIINGDWSWAEYLAADQIDAVVAPLPRISETGLPMQPMVATKGYSLNVNATGEQARRAADFVRFMVSARVQRAFTEQIKTLPSRRSLLDDPALQTDPTLAASIEQLERSRPMPVIAEMRAVWDAMRPAYQLMLGGGLAPQAAASEMQSEAIKRIAIMQENTQPAMGAGVLKILAGIAVLTFLWTQRRFWSRLRYDWQKNSLAYLMVAPAVVVTAVTILYPFFYNVLLSLSNMSLQNFRSWELVGLQNFAQVFSEPQFLQAFVKTLIWTAVNVFFHVTIGVMLAVVLNGPVRGKAVYRVLLILPWAIPAYITALSWRGLFDFEFGAVNLILSRIGGLSAVNWLGDETNAFLACLITNIWLGFPFMMVIALGGLQGIPSELYEAARMDRVSRWQQFWHITLPMLRPVLAPAATLGAIWTFNNLNVVWLVTNGGEPADKSHILVSYVYKSVFNSYRYGYGAALSMVIFAILLVFSAVLLRKNRASEAVS